MSRISAAVIEHLRTRLPLQLAAMRADNPGMIAVDPKTWLAHEQFSGASAVNKSNTPVVMCTATAMTNARMFDRDGDVTTWKVDYLVRVIVALHVPERDGAHRLGAHPNKATEHHQDTYDAMDDYLTAVMDVLITQPSILGDLVVQPKGMQAVRYTPADPETIATYGEGEVAFTVQGSRTSLAVPSPLVETIDVTVRPDVDDPFGT